MDRERIDGGGAARCVGGPGLARAARAILCGLALLLAAPAAATGAATPSGVPLGLAPRGLAVDPATGHVFVAGDGPGGGRVLVVAGRSAPAGAAGAGVELGGCPAGVAVAPGAARVYVGDACGARVWVLDAASARVVAEIPVAAPVWDVAVDAEDGRAYALRWDGVGEVLALGAAPGAEVAVIAVAPDPWALAVDADGRVHVTHDDGGLTVVDGRRAAVEAVYATGLTGAPAPATLDAAGRLVVGGRDPATGAPRVAVVAGAEGASAGAAPPGEYVGALAADVGPGRVWGCSGGAAPVAWAADVATGAIGAVTPLGSSCAAAAVDPLTGRRYVAGRVGRGLTGLLTIVDGPAPDCPVDARPGRPPRCLA